MGQVLACLLDSDVIQWFEAVKLLKTLIQSKKPPWVDFDAFADVVQYRSIEKLPDPDPNLSSVLFISAYSIFLLLICIK